MDSVEYSELRYNNIVEEMKDFLKKTGYDPNKVPFIPISGWHGDNLVKKSENTKWYNGPTLIEAINNATPPKRPTDKPLRIPL
jgi:elongation factor 1-alpha